MKGGWDVPERDEILKDGGSSQRVRENEKGSVKGVEENGRGFDGGGELGEVDLDEADEGVATSGEGVV